MELSLSDYFRAVFKDLPTRQYIDPRITRFIAFTSFRGGKQKGVRKASCQDEQGSTPTYVNTHIGESNLKFTIEGQSHVSFGVTCLADDGFLTLLSPLRVERSSPSGAINESSSLVYSVADPNI